MLSLPLITPRDSHDLWFGSSQPYRTSHQHHQTTTDTPPLPTPRRNGSHPNGRASSSPSNSLSTLLLEERALRARKNNIASFGYSWIKPAGCSKTMLGMKEEEAEREEALAAAAAEMAAAAAATADPALDEFGDPMHDQGDESGMERDLDDDIPDADADGLVEEGDEGLEEEDVEDEEGYMERDLDDDIPEAFPDDEEEEDDEEDEEALEDHEGFDDQPDLDDEIPSAANDYDEDDMSDLEEEEEEGGGGEEDIMERDLDDEIPEAAEDGSQEEDEWQHTDTDAEFDDADDQSFAHDHFAPNFRASTASSRGLPPPSAQRSRETEAQRRFLQRWSGGGDALDTSGMMLDEDDLRASVTSQTSRRSIFGRFPRRRTGRDSLE
ncbi:uncharacterized protein ACLA_027200 [Aspergillus clavatus NRRL 1]|uniref:Apc15p protein-domain-containing protein n=1 Tax=Aspergillus clavatus (strain ATCC 1007 / CBS 513.65 / DSM 816 / NCTC 3887 / NRRL 1 / QM 1276 / 107) TaxID=344612 RepID=A1CQS7_ASPCL|nr:uncharacterized protein ACLA_027200 [Aspergillus clavatus NRRL 1]EAW07998.1 conserved hypothetical protein [Aspergillus clavatus NRRL 1]